MRDAIRWLRCKLKPPKKLQRKVFLSEDFPEEWIDHRKVLKLIFNAARCDENLKSKTHLSKDKLFINGKTFTAGPHANFNEANSRIDVASRSTCQKPDSTKTIFLGIHSVLVIFTRFHLKLMMFPTTVLNKESKVKRPVFLMMTLLRQKLWQRPTPTRSRNWIRELGTFPVISGTSMTSILSLLQSERSSCKIHS